MYLLFPFESKSCFISHKKLSFCKSFVRKNLSPFCLVCTSTTPLTQLGFLPLRITVGPGWRGPSAFNNYSGNDRDCKYVLPLCEAVCLQKRSGLASLTVAGPLSGPIAGSPARRHRLSGSTPVSPLWAKPSQCFAQVVSGCFGSFVGARSTWCKTGQRAALTLLKSLSSSVTSLRLKQLASNNDAIVLILSDRFLKCFSKSILQHYKKIISCLRRSPSGV